MSIKACHHHGFTVSDLDRSIPFYRDVLGLELVRVSERRNLPSYDQIIGHDNIVLLSNNTGSIDPGIPSCAHSRLFWII